MMEKNLLLYGDNLTWLRDQTIFPAASVDLIYLDPPYNSNRSYNILFKNESGIESEAQIQAFDDTWHWNEAAEATYHELTSSRTADHVATMIEAMRTFIGANQMMAYLVMMTSRLIELHRVLKPTGSLYLHCDSTASHYLKIILDTIFGVGNFANHITWQRSDTHNDAKHQFPAISDHILFYRKSSAHPFHAQYASYPEKTLKDWYQYLEFPDGSSRRMTKEENATQSIPKDARRFNAGDLRSPNPRPNLMYEYKGYTPHRNGWAVSYATMQELDAAGLLIFPSQPQGRIMRKRYLDEQKGVTVGDVWSDVNQLRAATAESLGYPTQKPLALLERIIQASSHEGDVILDPFCGCGTAIAAAEKLNRKWIGIDITSLSISVLKYRLADMFPDMTYEVRGEPRDVEGAYALKEQDKYQFQWWACSLVKAQPLGSQDGGKTGKKGSDKGIDGSITFKDDHTEQRKKVLIQVKSGHVKSGDIRDLVGTLDREKAEIGVFITLEEPSRDMRTEAVSAGYYHSDWWNQDYPRIQILTIQELLEKTKTTGNPIQMPPEYDTFKRTRHVQTSSYTNSALFPNAPLASVADEQ